MSDRDGNRHSGASTKSTVASKRVSSTTSAVGMDGVTGCSPSRRRTVIKRSAADEESKRVT
eukprot:4395753-Amphidinium_carterae.1